jgi:Amt family ammonium transporter
VQFGRQAVLAGAGLAWPFIMTLVILWITDKTVGLRVSSDEEATGLDLGEHAEVAYEWPWDTLQPERSQPPIPETPTKRASR